MRIVSYVQFRSSSEAVLVDTQASLVPPYPSIRQFFTVPPFTIITEPTAPAPVPAVAAGQVALVLPAAPVSPAAPIAPLPTPNAP